MAIAMGNKRGYKETVYFWLSVVFSFIICWGAYESYAQNPKWLNFLVGMAVLQIFSAIVLIGVVRGSGIKITARQFPDIYAILVHYANELQLKHIPDMYLLQGNGVLNAFAAKFGVRKFVVLHSDVFELAYQEGIEAVSFIIGHELGHIKCGHVSWWRRFLIFPAFPLSFAYSRACEYACDRVGYSLCPEGAVKGLLLLAGGKKLYKKINVDELLYASAHDRGFVTWFATIFSTHPLLADRIKAINELHGVLWMEEKLQQRTFVSPQIQSSFKEANRFAPPE